MKFEIGTILIIIAILLNCSVFAGANSGSILKEDKDEPNSQKLVKVAFIKRAFAQGNASSGRTIDKQGKIGIIKFDFVQFKKLNLLPVRWEFADYKDATAIVFGIDQEIPEGPFEFQIDWVRAIVFYR